MAPATDGLDAARVVEALANERRIVALPVAGETRYIAVEDASLDFICR